MTTTPDSDVVDVLSTDHREAFELIAEIRATADGEHRRDLTDSLIAELVRHSVAEEMFVYPAMRDSVPDGAEAVDHDTAEHKELEQLMKALEHADTGEPAFLETLARLEEVLRDHVQDEEGEQFPEAAGPPVPRAARRAGRQGRDGQEGRADPPAPRRAERRAVPQDRRPRRRPGRPAPRRAERTQHLTRRSVRA